MSTKNKKQLNILILNWDWRNIFSDSFQELYDKLERDQLKPDLNRFFLFSWAHVNYHTTRDVRFESVHKKTQLSFFRPIVHLMSMVVIPRVVKKAGFKPDIIFVYDIGLLPAARRVKMVSGGKVVLCLTSMTVAYSATRRWGKIKASYSFIIERTFLKFADYFYTINHTMKEYLVGLGIEPQHIVLFFSNTIERDRLHFERAVNGFVREKYRISQEKKIILSVGRLEAEKGFPRLLNIFSQLSEDYVLIILGRGSLLQALEKEAQNLGIEKRVIFTGFVHREEIWNYYKDADVFMLLSNVEALGLVFWEAMYANVPVIGSTAPGIVETIGSDLNRGRICEPNEAQESIIKKIDFCISASLERNAMIDRAYDYVISQHRNTETINTFFDKISNI